MGQDPNDQDASEGYISQLQTRAVFIIETKELGLVSVIPTGMVEISTCIINDKMVRGAGVKKGDELGHFQFGGSTHCLIFQEGVIDKFDKEDLFFREHDKHVFVKVGERIAKAK
jgi:phosphatidylserine decarboxylase